MKWPLPPQWQTGILLIIIKLRHILDLSSTRKRADIYSSLDICMGYSRITPINQQ